MRPELLDLIPEGDRPIVEACDRLARDLQTITTWMGTGTAPPTPMVGAVTSWLLYVAATIRLGQSMNDAGPPVLGQQTPVQRRLSAQCPPLVVEVAAAWRNVQELRVAALASLINPEDDEDAGS